MRESPGSGGGDGLAHDVLVEEEAFFAHAQLLLFGPYRVLLLAPVEHTLFLLHAEMLVGGGTRFVALAPLALGEARLALALAADEGLVPADADALGLEGVPPSSRTTGLVAFLVALVHDAAFPAHAFTLLGRVPLVLPALGNALVVFLGEAVALKGALADALLGFLVPPEFLRAATALATLGEALETLLLVAPAPVVLFAPPLARLLAPAQDAGLGRLGVAEALAALAGLGLRLPEAEHAATALARARFFAAPEAAAALALVGLEAEALALAAFGRDAGLLGLGET